MALTAVFRSSFFLSSRISFCLMSTNVWIGCLRIPDVPAWALGRAEEVQDPFVVVENGHVAGASRTPRKEGVEPGMTRLQAISLCEEADLVPRDHALEETTWEGVLANLNGFTPRIGSERPGRAWFEPRRGEALRQWLESTPYHCGVGPTRPVALLAAWKAAPGRLICIDPEYEDVFLSQIPVDALADLGFSEELAERLRLFGYPNVGDPSGLSKRHLDAQFAAEGERLYGFLHPESRRVSFYSPPPSMTVRREFEHDVTEPGPLRTALEEVAETLEERLEGKAGQRLTVCLSEREGETKASRSLREPTADRGTIYRIACILLEDILAPDMEVQSIVLTASGLRSASGSQANLFFERPALKKAVATVQEKHPEALYRVHRDRGAVFEENRFTYEPVSLDS